MASAISETHHEHHAPVEVPDIRVDVSKLTKIFLGMLVLGFAVYFVGGFMNLGTDREYGLRDFFLTYQCGFIYWVCIPFGSLGLSMIGYLTQASWGIVLRRVFQANMRCIPVMFVLGLPIVASLYIEKGNQSPFWWSASVYDGLDKGEKEEIVAKRVVAMVAAEKDHGHEMTAEKAKEEVQKNIDDAIEKFTKQGWRGSEHGQDQALIAELAAYRLTNPEAVEEDLHKVHDFLNVKFFSLRYLIYFAIIGGLSWFLSRQAKKSDDENSAAGKAGTHNMSGPGVVLFVLTLSVFATDWVMSIEPTWASSMFPVIFGMNMFLCTLTFSTLVFYTLVRVPGDKAPAANRPDMTGIVKDKFRIDIGSLTLGFCMLWAYGSFCQFMLIWAGNLPEEITYYLKRGANYNDSAVGTGSGWIYLTYILMLFHWLVPFITLLMREVKTSPKAMKIVTLGLLAVCACDVVWWILPCVPHENSYMHVPMAFGAILGVGGIFGLVFVRELKKANIFVRSDDGKFVANWGHH